MRIDMPPDPTGAAFATYVRLSAPTVAVSLPEGVAASAFSLVATNWQLPGAVVSRITSTAQLHRRGADEIAADRSPSIMIVLHVAGRVEVTAGGREFATAAGDVTIYDYARPFECVVPPFTVLSATVARERVPPVLFAPGAHGLHLAAASPAARLIGGALAALVDVLDEATLSEAEAGLAGLCTLAGGLVEARLAQARGRATWLASGGDALLASAGAYIAERCDDPALNPRDVASHLGVSRSGLYRLFEGHGGVEAAITARRLTGVVRRLLLDVEPMPPLHDLAVACGFASAGRLQRAFEARFGTTPQRFRHQVESHDRTWLAEQAKRAGFASLEAWIEALSPDPDAPAEDQRPSGTGSAAPRAGA